jgi:hypothetical protein
VATSIQPPARLLSTSLSRRPSSRLRAELRERRLAGPENPELAPPPGPAVAQSVRDIRTPWLDTVGSAAHIATPTAATAASADTATAISLPTMPSAVRLASQQNPAISAITPIAPVICAWQAGVSARRLPAADVTLLNWIYPQSRQLGTSMHLADRALRLCRPWMLHRRSVRGTPAPQMSTSRT